MDPRQLDRMLDPREGDFARRTPRHRRDGALLVCPAYQTARCPRCETRISIREVRKTRGDDLLLCPGCGEGLAIDRRHIRTWGQEEPGQEGVQP